MNTKVTATTEWHQSVSGTEISHASETQNGGQETIDAAFSETLSQIV